MSNLKTMHAAANGKLDDRDQFNFGWGRYARQRVERGKLNNRINIS